MIIIFFKSVISAFLATCCVWLISAPQNLAHANDDLQFSGFARVVLGYLDDENAQYLGYQDKLSIDNQSLIGLQADYQFSDKLALTGQFIGHTGKQKKSGLEWLYLTYQAHRSFQLKIGKQRTPFFNYSDSIDVGFAYPWVTLPQQVYNSIFFSTFDGVLANYQWSNQSLVLDIEGYWGNFNDKIYAGNMSVGSNVEDLHGAILKLNVDNWEFRSAYHTADADIIVDELRNFSQILTQYGYVKSAAALNTKGWAKFYQASANYENLHYFFRSEFTRTRTQAPSIPAIDSFYLALGYNHAPFSSYLSFAKSEGEFVMPPNEIPTGFDPQLDALADAYQNLSQFPYESSESITLGTRYDWRANVALKAEVTFTQQQPDNRTVAPNASFKTIALYQFALEWVF
ncbi:hypothetical protein [Paraglaciecola aestuariivivens]